MNFKELESKRKLRGGYYTPLPIAEFLCRWAVCRGARSVLEPSCGDGVFLAALKSQIEAGKLTGGFSVDAVEFFEEEATKAAAYVAPLRRKNVRTRIVSEDFFSWLNSLPAGKKWEAIVGNPPYIRYQYFDQVQRNTAEEIFGRANVPFTKRTNAWVPFVIGSVTHLSPGGRIAMVIPAEIPYIQHADGLRRLLEQEMELIRLVYFREIVFDGTLQGTVLFLGTKRCGPSIGRLVEADSTQDMFACSGRTSVDFEILDIVDIDDLGRLEAEGALEPSPRQRVTYGGEWMLSLLKVEERNLINTVCSKRRIQRFKKVASVDIGIVTGANKYFCVDEPTVRRFGLASIVHPMLARSELMSGIVYTARDHNENVALGRSVYFLRFPNKPSCELPSNMAKYIKIGQEQNLHKRYKCRIRDPWYVVPYVWVSELAMLKRCHQYPRLVLNDLGAYSTDTAYRVRMMPGFSKRAKDLVFSFLNSLTFLEAELLGRHYAGGVLELVPSEVEILPIPLTRVTCKEFNKADRMIRSRCTVEELLDFTDPIILGKGIGLSKRTIRKIRACHQRIQQRRLRVASS